MALEVIGMTIDILVIENEEDRLNGARQYFRMMDMKCDVARNEQEALQAMTGRRYDGVIINIDLHEDSEYSKIQEVEKGCTDYNKIGPFSGK